MNTHKPLLTEMTRISETTNFSFELHAHEAFQIPVLAKTGTIMRAQICWDIGLLDIDVRHHSGQPITNLKRIGGGERRLDWRVETAELVKAAIATVSIRRSDESGVELIRGQFILETPPFPPEDEEFADLIEPIRQELDRYQGNIFDDMRVSGNPYIVSIDPPEAYPGEKVTVIGRDFGMIWRANFTVDGITRSADEMEKGAASGIYLVTVPLIKEVPADGRANMYIQREFPEPADSQPRPFTFKPMLAPVITAIAPLKAGPGEEVTLTGANFGQTTRDLKVTFRLDQTNIPVKILHPVSDSQITVTVPQYSASGITAGEIIVTRQYPAAILTGRGNFLFRSTRPIIDTYDYEGVGALSPDTEMWIYGQGFGNNRGKVQLELLPGENPGVNISDWSMNIIGWQDDMVRVKLSEAFSQDGMLPFNAQFFVQTQPQVGPPEISDRKLIRIEPRLETRFLAFTDPLIECGEPTASGGGLPGNRWEFTSDRLGIIVTHEAGFFDGHRGDDSFCRFLNLKNYWKVDAIHFKKIMPRPGEGDAYITEQHRGTDNPTVKVHWWNSPIYDHAVYSLAILLKGPKGTSYS